MLLLSPGGKKAEKIPLARYWAASFAGIVEGFSPACSQSQVPED